MALLRAVQHLSFPSGSDENFLAAVQNATPVRVIVFLTFAGALAAFVRFILKLRRAGPAPNSPKISGSTGEKWRPRRRWSARSFLSFRWHGASLGREAAPKQVGALIASLFTEWIRIPDPQRRLLAACGAGAGIAAVYNVPFGGAMFALEVLLGTISMRLAIRHQWLRLSCGDRLENVLAVVMQLVPQRGFASSADGCCQRTSRQRGAG
jgi:chloride channel protein, CIC family